MIDDNKAFQQKFGFDKDVIDMKKLEFRAALVSEEFNEMLDALRHKDAEEFVDAHVDMMVVILGNLYLLGVDIPKAWAEVFKANMSKERGIKPERSNSGGFDVIKPKGWVAPSHAGNHGILDELFAQD